ncbi:MAG: GNAT family N-acetyltransferase [Rhizobiales bacterium]|nr:GNAT family N-acetyltransferase [Hyphomicrobiales bacterium]
MSPAARLRAGRTSDAADLAVLVDMAGRGLLNWYWGSLCEAGESAFAMGRDRIRNNADMPAHCLKWTIAEIEGEVAGAYTGYRLDDVSTDENLPDVYAPTHELEALVEGSWFLMALAVFAEHRRKGVASIMLADSEKQARQARSSQMSVLVESVNIGAVQLYQAYGFREYSRRAYIPFPGSRDDGDWILLTKEVAR